MLASFCACDVSVDDAEEGHLSETFDINEALEYISTIEPEKAVVSDDGLLAVARDANTSMFGFINVKGEWVITPRYAATVSFKDKYGLFLNGYSGYEYIGRDGGTVLSSYDNCQISESNHFSEGLLPLAVANGDSLKYVYVNENFNEVISAYSLPKVDGRWYSNSFYLALATPFNNGYAVAMRQRNSNCWDGLEGESAYVIDTAGKVYAALPKGLDADIAGIDNNGNIIVKTTDNLYGLCSKEGTQLIECKYRFLRHCDGSLYLACNDKGFWGYVNEAGDIVIAFQYQKALPFSEGLAAVYDGKFWGFIDETGTLAIESVFDDVAALKSMNMDAATSKGAFCEGKAAVKKDGYWIVIDQSEFPYICLTAEKCEGIDGCPFTAIGNGYVIYRQNVDGNILYGAMTTSGKKVLEPSFAYLDIFN